MTIRRSRRQAGAPAFSFPGECAAQDVRPADQPPKPIDSDRFPDGFVIAEVIHE
jgi:hypothetical protein